jgi:glutaredoxin
MKPIHHVLIALTCTTAFSTLLATPVKAAGACSVATRDKSNLSVYESPDEKSLINELRFGRKVDIKDSAKDSQGRAWVKVAGDYNGEYRQWGWVIRQYLECGSQPTATKGKKVVTVYGQMSCPATVRMLEQLSQNGIPHVFKDISDASNNQEMHQRAQKAPATDQRGYIPVVYINKNQWTRIGPGAATVVSAYRDNQ